jgi:outer membrane receptor for ferrienterochelin and colicins
MTFRTISLFFLLIVGKIYSQENSFSGRIIDQSDNKPLPGAIIHVSNSNKVTVSNENGLFNLNNIKKGNSNLRISLVGYESREVSISQSYISDSIQTIILKPVFQDLEAVVVTGTKTEKRLKDVPVLTQVVYAKKLKEKGVTTVGEALERELPGLDFNLAQNSLRPAITFQGMNSKYILILIDGERVAGEMNGSIDFARLNLDNVEQIEVVRGASSALYGSNAMGGVINIITKRPVIPLEISANTRYSKFNELSAGLSVSLKQNYFASHTNVRYNQTDGYDLNPKLSPGNKTQEPYSNVSVNQKFEFYPLQKLTIVTSGGGFFNRLFNGTNIMPADSAYAGISGNVRTIYTINDSNTISLSYASDLYSTYSIFYKLNNKRIESANDYLQSIKLLGSFKQKKSIITIGGEYLPEILKSARIVGISRSANDIIAFAQFDYVFSPSFSMVLGSRITKNSIYGLNYVPKLTIMTKYDNLISRFSIGMGFRSPTLKDLYYDFNHNFAGNHFYLKGNENLKPEKSKYIGYSLELNQNKLNHSINIYYNHVTDLIAFKQIDASTFQNMNDSSANIIGIDIMERAMPMKGFTISAGLSLVDARNSVSGIPLYNFNPVSANFSLNYSFKSLNNWKTVIDFQGKYTGFRTYEPTNTLVLKDKPYSYFKSSINQYFKNSFLITLGIDNLFNEVNSMSFDNTSPGRRYFISLNYTFTKY